MFNFRKPKPATAKVDSNKGKVTVSIGTRSLMEFQSPHDGSIPQIVDMLAASGFELMDSEDSDSTELQFSNVD